MTLQNQYLLKQYIASNAPPYIEEGGIVTFPVELASLAMQANSYYFGHPQWAKQYLDVVHREPAFQERWNAVIGSWQDKIVVDLGCAPGNVYAALKELCGQPKLMIGVDISRAGLGFASELGYIPVLADARNLPFISGFADVVTLNATLHHSDDMEQVLREAARIVRPGGLLLTDHDLQQTMWNNNWVAHLIWKVRLPIYRLMRRGGHASADEQFWCQVSETHHYPGGGVTPEFFRRILEPLGFKVDIYAHNRNLGAEVLKGNYGRANWNIRLAQRLSGVNPDSAEGALVIMCAATRKI